MVNAKWEQLLEYIVNDESDKAKELFHEIVVAESRSIYADLLETEVEEATEETFWLDKWSSLYTEELPIL
mgnify:CR=1 FL=1